MIGIVDEKRRQEILESMHFDEKAEFDPYKIAFEKRAETLKRKKEEKNEA